MRVRIAVIVGGILAVGLTAALLWAAGTPKEREGTGPPSPPDIVLVVLDTVRADATGLGAQAGQWKALTPNLDRLAAEGTAFTSAWATAPWTVPSHASLFTGLLPVRHGANTRNRRLDPALGTSAALLRGVGYETAAFFSNPWLSDRASGLLRGFEVRRMAKIGGLSDLTSRAGDQGGAETLRNVARWLDERDESKRFLLFVNLLEAHLPYDPPEDYRSRRELPASKVTSIEWAHQYNAGLHPDDTVDWNQVRQLYGGDVAHADQLLGELLALLKRHDAYDDSVVIVTSDHGENLGDHDLMEHQYSVHETLLAVPLVIRAPSSVLAPGLHATPVILTDLYPTIAQMAGADFEPADIDGRSLLDVPSDALRGRPLIGEYSLPPPGLLATITRLNPGRDLALLKQAWRTVRVDGLRLTLGSEGTVLLHDVIMDPDQERNLAAERKDDVARLSAILGGVAPTSIAEPRDPPELDPRTAEELRALGYLGDTE